MHSFYSLGTTENPPTGTSCTVSIAVSPLSYRGVRRPAKNLVVNPQNKILPGIIVSLPHTVVNEVPTVFA